MASDNAWKMQLDSFFKHCDGSPKDESGRPIWGYYVYLTHNDSDVDDTALMTKLRGYSEAWFKHAYKQPYGEQMTSTLHLDAVPLHGASLDEVRTHFQAHFRDDEFFGPRYDYVLVIDDEVLRTLRAGPEPLLKLPPHDGKDIKCYARTITTNGEADVFVKAVELAYKGGEEGKVFAAAGRGRGGGPVWKGVLKVSPHGLHELWTNICIDVISEGYKGDDSRTFGV